jgi:CRISPR-associated protein Csd1
MLSLLAQYATAKGIVVEPGFKPKTIRWGIVFDSRGSYVELMQLGDVDDKRNRGEEFPVCPDLSQPEMKARGAGCRHFLVDTTEVVALYSKKTPDTKLLAKHAFFTDLLREASTAVPSLGAIAVTLQSDTVLTAIRNELTSRGARPTDNATIAVLDGGVSYPVAATAWHGWWRDFRKHPPSKSTRSGSERAVADARMRCFVSGALVRPAATHPKIEGLSDVGGLSMGDALVSFKQDAFRSYGLDQSANAAVSEEMASAYRAGLNTLLRSNGRRLGDAKVVHWYSGNVPRGLDPIIDIVEGESDEEAEETAAEADARGRKLIGSFASGEDTRLMDYSYYMLVLSGASGRVMIRDWLHGQFGQIKANRETWFSDLEIVQRHGSGMARRPKFMAVIGATVRDLKDAPAPFIAKMWRVATRGEAIPRDTLARALARVRADLVSDTPPNHARMGLLKAYHVRNGDGLMRPTLNDEHPSPAYHCGRLLAIYAAIQRRALGDVGAGVVERYYAAASATPALVLGRLARTAQYHLAQIREHRLREWFDQRLADVWICLADRVPLTLTLEEQSLFALGYYQQKAFRFNSEQAGAIETSSE